MHSLATPSLHAAKRVKMGQRKAVVDLLIRLLGMTVMPISPLLMKRIPGCINILASVIGNRTCSWKPAVQKAVTISARLTPTNSVYNASSSTMRAAVVRPSGIR
jgi:hypothetical protein